MEDMVQPHGAVARAQPPQLVVADMPWTSYHLGRTKAVANAARLVRAGAGRREVGGGRQAPRCAERHPRRRNPRRRPHRPHSPVRTRHGRLPGPGTPTRDAKLLVEDAIAISEAGCFAIVLEGMPDEVASEITRAVHVPTFGIGAGPSCDGQVLVFHDIVGMGGPEASLCPPVRRPRGLGERRSGQVGRRRARKAVPFCQRDIRLVTRSALYRAHSRQVTRRRP